MAEPETNALIMELMATALTWEDPGQRQLVTSLFRAAEIERSVAQLAIVNLREEVESYKAKLLDLQLSVNGHPAALTPQTSEHGASVTNEHRSVPDTVVDSKPPLDQPNVSPEKPGIVICGRANAIAEHDQGFRRPSSRDEEKSTGAITPRGYKRPRSEIGQQRQGPMCGRCWWHRMECSGDAVCSNCVEDGAHCSYNMCRELFCTVENCTYLHREQTEENKRCGPPFYKLVKEQRSLATDL